MSWAGLASNQCVSCNNLQDAVNNGVFTLKNTIPSSAKEINVSEAENYVNINTISKPSNRLVVKSDLVSSSGYYTWHISAPQPSPSIDGCYLGPDFPTTVYTNNSDFLSQAIYYTDTALTNTFDGFGYWYSCSSLTSGPMVQIGPEGETFNFYYC